MVCFLCQKFPTWLARRNLCIMHAGILHAFITFRKARGQTVLAFVYAGVVYSFGSIGQQWGMILPAKRKRPQCQYAKVQYPAGPGHLSRGSIMALILHLSHCRSVGCRPPGFNGSLNFTCRASGAVPAECVLTTREVWPAIPNSLPYICTH